ncbi:AI-2E family transporter [Candidatus Saccharibacteria bacterium]|nr:AI-2E family transporter [Candidatus Saccharibacteria bacterium]
MTRKIEVGTETFVRFWLVIVVFFIALLFINAAATAILIIGLAIFFAIAINPLVNKINRSGKRRALASILSVLLIVGVVGGIVAAVGPVVVNETSHYFSETPGTGGNFERGARMLNDIGNNFGIENLSTRVWDGIRGIFNQIMGDFGNSFLAGASTVVGAVTATILTIVLTITFLIEGPSLLNKFWAYAIKKNKKAGTIWQRIITKMADVVAKYVTGQLSVAILDGIMVSAVVSLLSIIFHFSMGLAIPMGLITMTTYMIPMVGPVIGCAVVSILIFFSSPGAALTFAIFYLIYQQIESNIIAPHIQGSKLQLPISMILVAIVIGMYVFGILGAIISIPIAGCIRVLLSESTNLKQLRE